MVVVSLALVPFDEPFEDMLRRESLERTLCSKDPRSGMPRKRGAIVGRQAAITDVPDSVMDQTIRLIVKPLRE